MGLLMQPAGPKPSVPHAPAGGRARAHHSSAASPQLSSQGGLDFDKAAALPSLLTWPAQSGTRCDGPMAPEPPTVPGRCREEAALGRRLEANPAPKPSACKDEQTMAAPRLHGLLDCTKQ